jgi:hypothetical protein
MQGRLARPERAGYEDKQLNLLHNYCTGRKMNSCSPVVVPGGMPMPYPIGRAA